MQEVALALEGEKGGPRMTREEKLLISWLLGRRFYSERFRTGRILSGEQDFRVYEYIKERTGWRKPWHFYSNRVA